MLFSIAEDKQRGSHTFTGGGRGFYRSDGTMKISDRMASKITHTLISFVCVASCLATGEQLHVSHYGHRSTATLSVVAVLLVLSVVAGLGTWVVVAKRRRRKVKAGKELVAGRGLGESAAVTMGTGFSVSVVKRK